MSLAQEAPRSKKISMAAVTFFKTVKIWVMVMLPPKRICSRNLEVTVQKKIIILDHFPVGQGPLEVVYMCFFSGELEHNLNLPFQKELFCVALSCLFRNLLRR